MANFQEFTDWLCMEGLRRLINKSAISPFFNTDFNKEFDREFPVGESVRVPLPQRWTITDGIQYSSQPINRKHVTVNCDQLFGIHFQWDSVEKALKMGRSKESIKKEYLDGQIDQMAAELDQRCANWAYKHTNNIVGALGTNPTSIATYLAAEQRLFENSCPTGDLGMIISPGMQASFVGAQTALFNPGADLSKQWRTGRMGEVAGFDFYRSNHLYTHTAGTWAGVVEPTAAVASGASSMVLTCTTGDTFFEGDIFTITGVNNANPVTRRSTGSLKQFRVTADATGAASSVTLSFAPALEGPGSQYQNVDSLPAAGADLVLMPGTASPNGKVGVNGLGLHKNAFALVGVALEVPKSAEMSSQMRDPETGLALRYTRTWDAQDSTMKNRLEMLVGFGDLYPDNCAVRVASST